MIVKRDRKYHNILEEDEEFPLAIFQREVGNTARGIEEFSDESLFGEDRIEDLLDKKHSF